MTDAIMQKGLSSVELRIATQADLLRHLQRSSAAAR